MPFKSGDTVLSFDPEALSKMQRAFDTACLEIGLSLEGNNKIRDAVAKGIITAFEAGRDEKTVIAFAVAEARQVL